MQSILAAAGQQNDPFCTYVLQTQAQLLLSLGGTEPPPNMLSFSQ